MTNLGQVFRDEWGRVVAAMIGFLGDFDLAEEAAQDAFMIAAGRWPVDGQPDNPLAWLVATARNAPSTGSVESRTWSRSPSCCRCNRRWTTRLDATTFQEERLELVFSCCHPACDGRAGCTHAPHARRPHHRRDRPRVRRLGGHDGSAAGAREAQDPGSGHPVQSARRCGHGERLDAVLAVVYLIFNEGYTGRGELSAEALWLGRALVELMPHEAEVMVCSR